MPSIVKEKKKLATKNAPVRPGVLLRLAKLKVRGGPKQLSKQLDAYLYGKI